jgi:Holliday junction resolvasome RuvABC endonuclease subunit
MHKRTDTILALDPGLRELGFAVLRGPHILDAGVRPLRDLPASDRLAAAKQSLRTWIRAFQPTVLVWEATPNHSVLGHARVHRFVRFAARVASRLGIQSVAYSTKTVRQHVVGDGWATKAAVADALTARFPHLRVYRGFSRQWKERYWHNLFDAAALALHHQSASQPPSRSR